jgi:hypothetical protein
MQQIKKLLLILILLPVGALAQTGGSTAFNFLNNSSSARVAALGGVAPSIADNDLSIAFFNPSLISPELNNHLALNYTDFYQTIQYGDVAYAKTYDKLGSFVAGMQFVNYGKFSETDEAGNDIGSFSAGEYAFSLGWGRRLDSLFSIGADLKFIYSSLEIYHSYGIAADIAATYYPDSRSSLSFVVRNVGRQLTPYQGSTIQPIPFEIQLAFSSLLKHLPLRYSIVLHDLQRWNLRYDDPLTSTADPVTGETVKQDRLTNLLDEGLRHLVIGLEFMPVKNFAIRVGYNDQRRKEMALDSRASTVGFSWGLGLRVKKININYARSTWHLNGSPNYISITANLSDLF